MTTIQNFLQHRLAEAKRVMCELAPPWIIDSNALPKPAQSLPKKWHTLLETSLEMVMQERHVNIARQGLTSAAYTGMSDVETGRRYEYNLRTWFIHAYALGERTWDVIDKTVRVFVSEKVEQKQMGYRYCQRVNRDVLNPIKEKRNQFAHGGTVYSTQTFTREKLWEPFAIIGLSPIEQLDQHFYVDLGAAVKAGRHKIGPAIVDVLPSLEMILGELESELGLCETSES